MDGVNTVQVELEDGTVIYCEILSIFEVSDNSYVALAPIGGDKEINNVIFYGCNEDLDSQELNLIPILDDFEFSMVSESFLEIMNDYSRGNVND